MYRFRSAGTMGKRLSQISVENNEDNRRQYRQLLFTTQAEKLKEHISGVILFHETFYQKVGRCVCVCLCVCVCVGAWCKDKCSSCMVVLRYNFSQQDQ